MIRTVDARCWGHPAPATVKVTCWKCGDALDPSGRSICAVGQDMRWMHEGCARDLVYGLMCALAEVKEAQS